METMVLFKVSENTYAIDQKYVKQQYHSRELFSERASKAKKVKIRLDGRDIPLYELPDMFSESAAEKRKNNSEAMLIKDEEGHMVLLADKIEGACEIEKESIEYLPPVMGRRSRLFFPKVFTKDNVPVLVLDPSGLRADAEVDETRQ